MTIIQFEKFNAFDILKSNYHEKIGLWQSFSELCFDEQETKMQPVFLSESSTKYPFSRFIYELTEAGIKNLEHFDKQIKENSSAGNNYDIIKNMLKNQILVSIQNYIQSNKT